MAKLAHQWLELFRAGKYPQGNFTREDVAKIVANYDGVKDPAPAVIGHPRDDRPAYAWFGGLKAEGDLLLGKVNDDVDPAFEQGLRDGRYKKKSVKLVREENGWALRHVGFLGAMAPGVKGLAAPHFHHHDENEPSVEIEFMEEIPVAAEANQINEDKLVDRLTKFFSEQFEKLSGKKHGTETAEQAQFGEEQVRKIVEDSLKPLRDENEKLTKQFSERESAATTAGQKAAVDSAIGKLQAGGHWVPAFEKMGGRAIFEELAKSGATVEFGEGAEKKTLTPLETMVAFMEGFGKIVPTGEKFTGQGDGAKKPPAVHFTEGRSKADPNSVRLAELAQARAKEKNIAFGEALSQVGAEHPELTVAGGASAGQV